MSRIFWDTNLFIYLMEDAGPHAQQVVRLIERMWERNDQLCTSTLTLGELLVKPLEKGNRDLCDKYEEVLSQHVVFFAQVVDDVLLMLVDPAGQDNLEEAKRIERRPHSRQPSIKLPARHPQDQPRGLNTTS